MHQLYINIKKVFSFVLITFQEENENNTLNNFQCVFWDFDLENGHGDWSNEGCMLVETTESDRRVCHCDHLTSFAVLIVSYLISIKKLLLKDVVFTLVISSVMIWRSHHLGF